MTQTVLRYPLKVFTEQTDYLQIDVQEYVPVGSQGGRNIDGQPRVSLARNPRERFRRLSNKRPISTVLLPMPSNLQDGNSVSYNDSAMNSITAAAIGGFTSVAKAGQAKSTTRKKFTEESNRTLRTLSSTDISNILIDHVAKKNKGIRMMITDKATNTNYWYRPFKIFIKIFYNSI